MSQRRCVAKQLDAVSFSHCNSADVFSVCVVCSRGSAFSTIEKSLIHSWYDGARWRMGSQNDWHTEDGDRLISDPKHIYANSLVLGADTQAEAPREFIS